MTADIVNDIIQKSGLYMGDDGLVWGDPSYDITDEVQELVRLVVLECAQRAAQLRHVYPHQAELTATTILDHFGVKP